MMKTPTGVRLSVEEFRFFRQCVQCGKSADIDDDCICSECSPIPHCEICDILLREGRHTFYAYDNKDEYREVNFNPLQNDIREFTYTKVYDALIEPNICNSCIGWETKMSRECASCGNNFPNHKEHYIKFGNVCNKCNGEDKGNDRGEGATERV